MAGKFSMGFFGVEFWSRDFFGFWFLPPFDRPCHLKSWIPPWVVLLTPLKDQTMLLKMILGSKGWHSGESACLPPMWPRFKSWHQCLLWVEFVCSLLCSKRFFSGYSAFPRGGGGGNSHTLPIRVCAAQQGRDFEDPDLEWGTHFRGVF